MRNYPNNKIEYFFILNPKIIQTKIHYLLAIQFRIWFIWMMKHPRNQAWHFQSHDFLQQKISNLWIYFTQRIDIVECRSQTEKEQIFCSQLYLLLSLESGGPKLILLRQTATLSCIKPNQTYILLRGTFIKKCKI